MFNDILGGASEFAHQIQIYETKAAEDIYSSSTAAYIPLMLKDVDQAWRSAFRSGWDGEHTKGISFTTKNKAELFIKSFPYGLVLIPEIGPETDGSIGFDWNRGSESFTVLIKEERIVYSAFLKDDERRKGSIRFRNSISKELLEIINYFGNSK